MGLFKKKTKYTLFVHNKCKLIETGEFRIPKVGEIYLGRNGGFLNFLDRYPYEEKILKPANKRSQRIMDKTIKELGLK